MNQSEPDCQWIAGWIVPDDERERLMQLIPSAYPDLVAHHVTLAFDVTEQFELPASTIGRIIGYVDDGRGVQAVVIEIDGKTERPDGSTFHITWSLDRAAGRKPAHSNDALREQEWSAFSEVIPVRLAASRFQ